MKFSVLSLFLICTPLIALALPVSRMQIQHEQARARFIEEQKQQRTQGSTQQKMAKSQNDVTTVPPEILNGIPMSPISEELGAPRYWTTQTGSRVMAKFKNFDRGWVVLEDKERHVFGILPKKLSETDRQFLISNWHSSWNYNERIDEMSDQLSSFASVISANKVAFDFPYEGGSHLILSLRKHPRLGNAVFISITKGQFAAESVMVRFDDQPAFQVPCSLPGDYSHDVLFLNNENRLVHELQQAHTMKIAVQFYNEGTRMFTFDVAGLIWAD